MNIPKLIKKSRIYIAGHTGMVGSSLVRTFKKAGYNNLILRTRRELDLYNKKKIDLFFNQEKPEFVILAAARVGGIKENMTHLADFLYENLEIQNNVIWSALNHDVKKLLFLGSSCIYPRSSAQPMKEEYFMHGNVEPTNEGYAIAKIAGMKLCEMIYNQYGRIFNACMPTNLYGVNDHFDPEKSHVIPGLIRRMYEAKINNSPEVVIWGSGNSRREFLYVDDAADAVVFLLKNYNEKGFINIGTGSDISIKELARKVKEVVGYQGKLAFDITKPDGMPRKRLDVSKLHSMNWHHATDLDTGLNLTYQHFLTLN